MTPAPATSRSRSSLAEALLDHSVLLALSFALVVLSVVGVGNVIFAAVAGLLLCGIGLFQRSATVDLWVLIPLAAYVVLNFASALAASGDLLQGYGPLHALFPIIYVLMGCLPATDLATLRRLCALWAGMVALLALAETAFQALAYGSIQRLAGLLVNPNALGIFLAMGWFCLMPELSAGGLSKGAGDCPSKAAGSPNKRVGGGPSKGACDSPSKEARSGSSKAADGPNKRVGDGPNKGVGGASNKGADRSPVRAPLLPRLLVPCEPLVLAALALTLSVGSFIALIVGMVVCGALMRRRAGIRAALGWMVVALARIVLASGTGFLLYAAVARTGVVWLCVPVLLYLLALVLLWGRVATLLDVNRKLAVALAVAAAAAAIALLFLRPSSAATFAERIQMMRNALGYLSADPLLGIGPFQWRLANQHDGDIYFNTWHIHNVPLHIAVEFGFPALIALLAIVVRFYRKQRDPAKLGSFTAFLAHNLADTSFFYLGITALALMSDASPHLRGRPLGVVALRIIFVAGAALFAATLIASRT